MDPPNICPILLVFARRWRIDSDDAGRRMIEPYIDRLADTKSTRAVEARRTWLATDWIVRVHTPAWLDLAGIPEDAAILRSLPKLRGIVSADAAHPKLRAVSATTQFRAARARCVRDAPRSTALDAACDAAWGTAWDASRDVVRAASLNEALAASDAARVMVIRLKLDPTQFSFQRSALDLLDRMIALTVDVRGKTP